MQWRPITEAKKDGTLYLLRYSGNPDFPYVGSWRGGMWGETPSNERAWRARCCGRYSTPDQFCELPT